MSTDQTYDQENTFKIQRNRLADLIKRNFELKEKLQERMDELKPVNSPEEEPISDLEV
jgi:hypothetical protein